MSHKLFVGITNGLELRVDERALEKLKQDLQRLLDEPRMRGGPWFRHRRDIEGTIQEMVNNLKLSGDCWIWTKGKDGGGYGQGYIANKQWKIQRLFFFLTHNTMPIDACHSCDTPPCANPDHVFNGTQADNVHDCIRKGRRGCVIEESAEASKLTRWQVEEIRRVYAQTGRSIRDLARQFAVRPPSISAIIHRKTWKHIP